MFQKRIVVCLDVRDGKTTKGIKFKGNVDIGDPVVMAEDYYKQGVDELVFYDITASSDKRGIMIDVVKEVAKRNKHTFISTGMSSIEEIDKAVKIFSSEKCKFELMHCVSTYPTDPRDVNLNTINALKKRYNCDVGYSGHENGTAISVAASMMGITSLERHITLDRTMYGSDQAASIEYSGMINLVNSIKKVKDAMGENKLGEILPDEVLIAKKLRAHIKSK